MELRKLRLCALIVAAGSWTASYSVSAPAAESEGPLKLGVFFGSYGDVDSGDEAYELVTTTLQDPDMVPLPALARHALAQMGWLLRNKSIREEYVAIGGKSNYRANSQAQADLVAENLRQRGYDAKGYTGFAFTFPHVDAGMAKAERDGVNRLVVFYQGAQHSRVTSHIIFREVKKYLNAHPNWRVKVTAVKSFSADPRFVDLVAHSIQSQIETNFPAAAPSDVCIFLPMHGNIMTWINQGDPSYNQMMAVVGELRPRFSENPIYFGFQNHDEAPFLKWTEPKDRHAIEQLAKDSCSKVVINGRISYTVDNLETLYDHAIMEKQYLIAESRTVGLPKQVVVASMFNLEPSFAYYLTDLTVEALAGEGRLLEISEINAVRPPLSDDEG